MINAYNRLILGRSKRKEALMGSNSQAGFTIIELMIALSVLATILVMTTVILIQINALYDKGINSAKLQNSARTLTADIQASIQFSGSDVRYPSPLPYKTFGSSSLKAYAVCVGDTRYTYVLDHELGTDTALSSPGNVTLHVLWRDKLKSSTAACVPLNITDPIDPTKVTADDSSIEGFGNTSTGYEMVPIHVRLGSFNIVPVGASTYSVAIDMAYGDTDLLSSTTSPYQCKGTNGSQFCATSALNTVVTRRLN